MKISIAISYYKALDNLKVILKAFNNQSDMDFEVIISEDDVNAETIDFLKNNKENYKFKIVHIFQDEDKGFRKNIMLNKFILTSSTDYLVFIDGDCIPHRHFVKEYAKNISKGSFFVGRAVMLDEKISKKVVKSKKLKALNMLSVLFSKSKHKKEGIYFPFLKLSFKERGLVGRNWGIYKKHLIDINGFDNDYVYAGVGEDVDVQFRLLASGIKRKYIKNKAIVYHIHHKKVYSEDNIAKNYKMLKKKKKENNIKCLNGLEQVKI